MNKNTFENIDDVKRKRSGVLKYKLSNADLYVSENGFHYIDYFDENVLKNKAADSYISEFCGDYVENVLEYNSDKYIFRKNTILKYCDIIGKSILDVGSGGGIFMNILKQEGAYVIGIELNKKWAEYSEIKYDLKVLRNSVDDEYILDIYSDAFDCVTIWDVIDSVDYPYSMVSSINKLLKKGGYFF